jgi:hypothetical protein
MITARELLGFDHLTAPYREARTRDALDNLGDIISADATNLLTPSMSIFATRSPWSHWDTELVLSVKQFLYKNPERAINALCESPHILEGAFRVVFDQIWSEAPEQTVVLSKPEELRTFAVTIIPAYLRLAEHAYANFLRFFWTTKGRKNFNTAAALQQLPKEISPLLTTGYNDNLRNGIAHGEMSFGVFEISYRNKAGVFTMDAVEVLKTLDELWSTCNSIALAILSFLSENLSSKPDALSLLPPAVLAFVIQGLRDRPGLSIETVLVHDLGKEPELNVYVTCQNQTDVIFKHEALKIAHDALIVTGWKYKSVLVAFDNGMGVPSQIRIMADSFQSLISTGNEVASLEDVMPLALIWKPLHPLFGKLQLYRNIWHIQRKSTFTPLHRLRIRSIENRSIGITARVSVTAVPQRRYRELPANELFDDVAALSHEIGRRYFLTGSRLEGPIRLLRRPTYVWIDLYREDQNLRRIGRGGWRGDNLMLKSEFRRGLLIRPILPGGHRVTVKNVDIILRPDQEETF